MWKEITILIRKEAILEWRQKYAINGILLYVVSAVFIAYLSMGTDIGKLSVPI
jgi:heme exporter protein B